MSPYAGDLGIGLHLVGIAVLFSRVNHTWAVPSLYLLLCSHELLERGMHRTGEI